jgi:hypothetical protein
MRLTRAVTHIHLGDANHAKIEAPEALATGSDPACHRHRPVLASRLADQESVTCTDRKAIKALLDRRHQEWKNKQRLAVVQPPAQLVRQRA